ncbi:MAG TPA: HEAT repeat domain-containing protein [Blastocatellia bacterium]|nr:HEAT repeat domain-containing protein [Blastocatellia bacterium]
MKLLMISLLACAVVSGAAVALLNENADTASAYAGITQGDRRQSFIRVDGPDLKSKLASAIKQGRSRSPQTRFWAAYSFDVRPRVAIDLQIIDSSTNIDITSGTVEAGSRYETRNVAVFLLYDAEGNSVVRSELYNLDRPREYAGHPVYYLGRGGNEESLDLLKSMIDETRSAEVAKKLTLAIAVHDYPRVETMLKDLIRASTVEQVRKMAVSWLPRFPGNIAFLSDIVRNDKESLAVREEAAEAIGETDEPEALKTLQSLYSSVTNRDIRRELLDSISENRDEEAVVTFLIRIAENEPDRDLRREAIEGLGERKEQRSLQALLKIVNDANADSEMQRTAVEAIGERDPDEAAPLLAKIARGHSNVRLREEAIEKLAEIPGQMPFLVELAGSAQEHIEVRRTAIEAIMDSREAGAMASLARLYEQVTDREVKREIISTFEDSEEQSAAVDFLMSVARTDPDMSLRHEAITTLGEIEHDRALESLTALYGAESNEEVKEEILSALIESGKKAGVRKVIEIARGDASIRMRKKAIELLGDSDDPEAVKFLEEVIR